MTRVAVFVDYQNVYHGVRDQFASRDDSPTLGHVHPDAYGRHVVDLGKAVDPSRVLAVVNVYRGEPVEPHSHPKLVKSFRRQTALWDANPVVRLQSRPLKYFKGSDGKQRAQEKGIDVLLALDLAIGARDDLFDVAVVASRDTDLVPAIEMALDAGKKVETVSWLGPNRYRFLNVKNRKLWNHHLDFELSGGWLIVPIICSKVSSGLFYRVFVGKSSSSYMPASSAISTISSSISRRCVDRCFAVCSEVMS